MKIKKLFTISLALVVLLTAVCLFTTSATGEAESGEIDLRIYGKNLSLEDSVYIYYAVPVEGTETATSLEMLFWLEPQSEYVYGTQKYTLSPEPETMTIGTTECYIFNFNKLAAKQMTVDVYAKVYATDESGAYYSSLDKYSILQYCYNLMGKTSSNVPAEKLTVLLDSMLEYGAAAQIYFDTNLDRLANDDYYQIIVNGATFSDGTNHGLYLEGEELSVTASETDAAGKSFLYWQNSAGEQVSEDAAYTITVGTANEIYTAVYGDNAPTVTDDSYFIFTKLSDGTYSVKARDVNNMPDEITIPSVYNDKPVSTIDSYAFNYCVSSSIILPDSITTIGDKAFANWRRLTTISLPNSITQIGESAFENCTNLTGTIYENAVYLGNEESPYLYLYKVVDTSVSSMFIHESTSIIGERAFSMCTKLQIISIPDKVTSIGKLAFYDCTSLTSISIGNGVTNIGEEAFRFCSHSLETIISKNQKYSSVNNCLIDTSTNTLILGCKNSTIPADGSVAKIDGWAFAYCTDIMYIAIPNSVTYIGQMAFNSCTNLVGVYYMDTAAKWTEIYIVPSNSDALTSATIYYYSETQPTTEGNYWRYVDGVPTVWEPLVATDESYFTFTLLEDDTYSVKAKDVNNMPAEVVIPATYNGKNVTVVEKEGFSNCTTIESVTIPNSVTTIGYRAFSRCYVLTNIVIPNSVTDIGIGVFEYCSQLASIVVEENNSVYHSNSNCLIETDTRTLIAGCKNSIIPTDGSVRDIGDAAFLGCTGLTSIDIPTQIKGIGNSAFSGCSGLTTLVLPNSITSIGNSAFWRCSKITSIDIPESVKEIGHTAFTGCSSVETITVDPKNTQYFSSGNCLVESKSQTLLAGCKNSEIPSVGCVTKIGPEAFYCIKISEITIPPCIVSIGDKAFKTGGAIQKVYISDLEAWCNISFEYEDSNPLFWNATLYLNNEPVTELVIPDSVTKIPEYAFINCANLTSVVIPYSVTEIEANAFSGTALETVYYTGRCEEWTLNVTVEEKGNEPLLSATLVHLHTEVIDEAVPATCTEPGLTEGKHCSVCGEILVEQTEIKAGHKYSWVVVAPATCTQKGVKQGTCSSCGDSHYDVIPAGHKLSSVLLEATCTTPAQVVKMCTVCNEIVGDPVAVEGSNPLGHQWENQTILPADCCNPIRVQETCIRCDITKITELDDTFGDHIFEETLISATCEDPVMVVGICSVCGEINGEPVAVEGTMPLGHKWDDGTVIPADCCSPERISYDCTRCDCVKTTDIGEELGDHIFEEMVIPATCTEPAMIGVICSVCGEDTGERFEVEGAVALGHQWDDGVIIVKPDATSTGLMRYTCQRKGCGAVTETVYSETDVAIVPNFDVNDFYKEKPASLENAAIVINAANCETGSTIITENSRYYLFNKDNNPGSAAHGVHKVIAGGIFHYYIDLAYVNQGIEKEYGEEYKIASVDDCYIRWTFTVTEPGTYTVGSYLRTKHSGTRVDRICQIQFDDQVPIVMNYTLEGDISSIQDATQGSYLIWNGVEVELEAGEHTLVCTVPAEEYRTTLNFWHWRTIYLMKKA